MKLSNFCHFYADTLLTEAWWNPHHRFCNLLQREKLVFFGGLRESFQVEKTKIYEILRLEKSDEDVHVNLKLYNSVNFMMT